MKIIKLMSMQWILDITPADSRSMYKLFVLHNKMKWWILDKMLLKLKENYSFHVLYVEHLTVKKIYRISPNRDRYRYVYMQVDRMSVYPSSSFIHVSALNLVFRSWIFHVYSCEWTRMSDEYGIRISLCSPNG